MPQLDKYSYFTQIFWLFFSLIALYLFFLYFVLPIVAATLKYRIKYITEIKQQIDYYAYLKTQFKFICINDLLFWINSQIIFLMYFDFFYKKSLNYFTKVYRNEITIN